MSLVREKAILLGALRRDAPAGHAAMARVMQMTFVSVVGQMGRTQTVLGQNNGREGVLRQCGQNAEYHSKKKRVAIYGSRDRGRRVLLLLLTESPGSD